MASFSLGEFSSPVPCACRITNEGLPTSLSRVSHLKAIGLKKNRLTSVPRLLGGLRSLQEIYLEDNDELEVCPALVPILHCFLNALGPCLPV